MGNIPQRSSFTDTSRPTSPRGYRGKLGIESQPLNVKAVLADIQQSYNKALNDERNHRNGVWLATTEEHHESLRREFRNMRSIQVLGEKV